MNDEQNNEIGDETRVVPVDAEQPEPFEQVEASDQPEPTEQVDPADSPVHDVWAEPEPTLISEPAPPRRTGSHPVNVGQLAMGLVFLAAVGVWALIQSDTVTGDDIRWLLPLPWVIGGGIGLFAAAISSVRRHGAGR